MYSKISAECSSNSDIFILCDNTEGNFQNNNSNPNYFPFTTDKLARLPYPGKSANGNLTSANEADWHHKRFNFDPGNVDLPILYFFRQNPGYDHYWVVEYDVRFSGAWQDFFTANAESAADLLGTTLTRRTDIEDWYYWSSLRLGDRRIDARDHIRGFFPIYRLSRRALERLDADYRSGAGGHFECLIPTLLNDAGMTLEDMGGTGEFVRPSNINRFYRNTPSAASLGPGTFVFRPVMDKPGHEPNMLWHPVRPPLSWRARSRQRTSTLLRLAGRVATRLTGSPRDTR